MQPSVLKLSDGLLLVCFDGLAVGFAEYIMKNGGIDTEEDYSYWSVGGMCNKLREGDLSLPCTFSEPSCVH